MPRLSLSVDGFVEGMGHDYRPATLEALSMWVPTKLLPGGVIQPDKQPKRIEPRTIHQVAHTKRSRSSPGSTNSTLAHKPNNPPESLSMMEIIDIEYTSSESDEEKLAARKKKKARKMHTPSNVSHSPHRHPAPFPMSTITSSCPGLTVGGAHSSARSNNDGKPRKKDITNEKDKLTYH